MTTALALTLSILCASQDQDRGTGQKQERFGIAVGNLHTEELEQFCRWAERRGVHTGGIDLSAFAQIDFYTTSEIYNALLMDFAKEYGVDFLNMSKFRPVFLFPEYDVSPKKPEEPSTFLARFSEGSLMKRAYNKSVKEGLISKEEAIRSCTYVLRPWLGEDGRRTERITGKINDKYIDLIG